MNFKKIINELKRRNVFRVATVYAVTGWLIIQVIAVINEPLSLPDKFDTIAIILIAAGLPIAIIFAWVFEFTPAGIKKTDEIEISQGFNDRTKRKLNRLTIAILALLLVLVGFERIFLVGSGFYDEVEPSIAVLPFVNMSSDKDNEYFSEGLSEELLNGLAKIQKLKVAARTSAFSFKGKNEDLRTVGQLLNVAHILEGSVRKDGNTIRITAQLIRASDGFHMWSETYDREMKGIFEIQEEISRKVINELRIKLLPEEEALVSNAPTENIEAYNAYLKATQWEVDRKGSEVDSAIIYYQHAISHDPSFGLAHARLAYAYALKNSYGNLSIEDTENLMRESIDKAMVLNADLPQSYQALGQLYTIKAQSQFPPDTLLYRNAFNAFSKAYELSPNDAFVLMSYQNGLVNVIKGKRQLGDTSVLKVDLKYIEKAIELDPLNPRYQSNYGNYLQQMGRDNEALSILKALSKRTPEFSDAYTYQTEIYLKRGDLDSVLVVNFQGYQNTGDESDVLHKLSNFSSYLGLYKMSEYFGKKWQTLYPDDKDGIRAKLTRLSMQEGRLNELLSLKNDFLIAYGPIFGPIIQSTFEARDLYFKGEFEKGIALIENTHSNIPDQLKVNMPVDKGFPSYNYLMIKAGRINAQDTLSLLNDCMMSLTSYFSGNNTKANILENINVSPNYVFFEGNPEYDAMKEKILADQKRMRDNVISYLKKEGEWRKEWEEDGL